MELPPDPTVEFGPRPPRPVAPPDRPDPRRRTFVTLLLALVGLAALGVGLGELRRPTSTRPEGPDGGAGSSTVGASCPPVASRPVAAATRSWSVDLLGVGCAQLVSWRAPVLTIELPDRTVRRYEMGQVGDQLLVGRFGCAAGPLLARYRPATGTLVQYPVLRSGLEPGGWLEPSAPRSGPPGGVARVVRDRSGCESIEIVVHG